MKKIIKEIPELIHINEYPVNVVLKDLLKDRSANQNIIFATNINHNTDLVIDENTQITKEVLDQLDSSIIQPRVTKSLQQQALRTKNKAEVFTPSWVCNKMNNLCDEEWFGYPDVFNTENDKEWIVNTNHIIFKDKNWNEYVSSNRLEITCGEAPYIVSRYDTVTGEIIPIEKRIGLLDRKIRIINENVDTESEWIKWIYEAYQSVYGYEYQGDNLLIARINILETFIDYMQNRWNRKPTDNELEKITDIITWNFWQMDGLKGLIPNTDIQCKIFDWKENKEIIYNNLLK